MKTFQYILIGIAVSLLFAYVDNNSNTSRGGSESTIAPAASHVSAYSAAIATVDPSFMGSALQIADIDYASSRAVLSAEHLAQDQSDYTVSAYGQHFYHIGRFQIDAINKYAFSSPTQKIWPSTHADGWSILGSDYDANAYEIVFVNEEKAYLIRYGSTKVWIINPSATDQAHFKLDELDLSAYDDGDGAPEMAAATIVGDKLFVVMQRLHHWCPTEDAYIAVFDINTNTEVDVNSANDPKGLKGIRLAVRNPSTIDYQKDIGLVVSGVGAGTIFSCTPPNRYSGGIEVIHPGTYQTSLLLDDGDEANHPYDFISAAIVLDKNNGYFVSYADWQDTKLYHFNPSTKAVTGLVKGFGDGAKLDIRLLKKAPDNTAWLGIAQPLAASGGTPKIKIIDTQQKLVASFDLERDPEAIAFVVNKTSDGNIDQTLDEPATDNDSPAEGQEGTDNGNGDNGGGNNNGNDTANDADNSAGNDDDTGANSCDATIAIASLTPPFAPPHMDSETTAIAADDPRFIAWATGHENYIVGEEVWPTWQTPEKALGVPGLSDGTFTESNRNRFVYDVVVLGDGGEITLTFDAPIRNGEGADFAVFENSFDHKFLELAWVEVSSDGINFFRFPNYSYTDTPVPGFGYVDATQIHGLAGKYQGGFGTPFDLEALKGIDCLDTNRITHVKIIDIVGNGTALDSLGQVIYDPHPTVQSAGFDLDAIGVIHQAY